MKSYKLDDYEGEITNTFLEKLTKKLNERGMVISTLLIAFFLIITINVNFKPTHIYRLKTTNLLWIRNSYIPSKLFSSIVMSNWRILNCRNIWGWKTYWRKFKLTVMCVKCVNNVVANLYSPNIPPSDK